MSVIRIAEILPVDLCTELEAIQTDSTRWTLASRQIQGIVERLIHCDRERRRSAHTAVVRMPFDNRTYSEKP